MKSKWLSTIFIIFIIISWMTLSEIKFYRSDLFPYFFDFLKSAQGEILSGRLMKDIIASLFRWGSGFFLAVLIGIPFGLSIGKNQIFQSFLSPYLNLFRSLSPLAWIPFAVIWFGIGDAPVIFLIFLGCSFPLIFSTINALKNVPKVYDQLAKDYHFEGTEYFSEILFPAILPQVISSLRLIAGLAWIVLVPAEMLAGKEGLGFAILDARNGLRTDLLVFNMLVVALIAHGVDVLLEKLNKRSKARWSYEQ
jgi:NitT/TauT family transport system permease protein